MQMAMMENVFRYRYNAAQNLGIDRPVAGAVVEFDQSNYINIVYSKGPLFLHAVRERIVTRRSLPLCWTMRRLIATTSSMPRICLALSGAIVTPLSTI